MEETLERARQLFLRGIEHFNAQRLAEARESFESALRLAPGRASVLGNLGITLFHMRQFAEAVPVLQQAVAAEADYAEAWISLGLSQEALGQWEAAADSLARGLATGSEVSTLWLVCGQCRARLGRYDAALEAFERATALEPTLAEAWSAKGDVLRELRRREEAAACFEKAIALGADAELHRFYLASLRDDAPVVPAPRQYVEGLFDDYAADFQTHLVRKLRYRAPERLLQPLLQAGRRFARVLDLGCGTGLCGTIVQPVAGEIHGVDLSRAMLEEARGLGVYHDLVHADLDSFLAATTLRPDLVIAADVFGYVGDLNDTFRAVRRLLETDGRFVFTVELSEDGRDLCLLPALRYAHSQAYVEDLARRHGFAVESLSVAPLRDDALRQIQGLYVHLR